MAVELVLKTLSHAAVFLLGGCWGAAALSELTRGGARACCYTACGRLLLPVCISRLPILGGYCTPAH